MYLLLNVPSVGLMAPAIHTREMPARAGPRATRSRRRGRTKWDPTYMVDSRAKRISDCLVWFTVGVKMPGSSVIEELTAAVESVRMVLTKLVSTQAEPTSLQTLQEAELVLAEQLRAVRRLFQQNLPAVEPEHRVAATTTDCSTHHAKSEGAHLSPTDATSFSTAGGHRTCRRANNDAATACPTFGAIATRPISFTATTHWYRSCTATRHHSSTS